MSDSFGKILGYIESDFDRATGIAEGWSVQVENRSGLGFNVTNEIFGEPKPSRSLLDQAMVIDSTMERAREEPRFIEFLPSGKKKEIPIYQIDKRSLDERILAAGNGEIHLISASSPCFVKL